MKYSEALEWLRGNRSMRNYFIVDDFDKNVLLTAQADAAMMQIAYTVVKAHKEGLLD